ncbi:hypothetical protein HH310_16080 [Actinoplanes sp. TBRC 11911]|uniref:hypothetical protein n=1 Tax=Actinoplanes sp. TBRC 11911 TaxID=2729386 RepID=UPI00145F6BED|nr:hypothetical protein [Actinoplanes sp. TBRC 11911]NMO52703.1 hypothetical protein [Actinoplanes sp. TBRC 11911]
MSEHHDDFGSFDEHHEPLPFDDTPGHDDTPTFDHDDHDMWADDPLPAADHLSHDFPEMSERGGDGGDHDAGAADHLADDQPGADDHSTAEDPAWTDPVDVFPPSLDVGELPEPVDGFPWIDTGSLGVVTPADLHDHTDPVRPEELAEYAGEPIPPGADPWATLAASDDPATSALARWWNQD